jgi:hypothetical protein
VFVGIAIGLTPGVLLWVIGAIVGGEALLSFGVIGILLGIVGMVIGGVVGSRAERSGSDARTSKAGIGAVIGCIPGVALLFFMTRIGIPVILVGGLIGAFLGGRLGASGGRPTPVH